MYSVMDQDSKSNIEAISVNFGVCDRFGRMIGARVTKYEMDYLPTDKDYGFTVTPGHYFMFDPAATRNGLEYGGWAGHRRFNTAADRDMAVSKYFEDAKKRAIKREGK